MMSRGHSESLDKLLPALIAARAEFPAVKKDGFNPHFKSKFSTLKAVQAATGSVLDRHGLVVTQFPSEVEGKPALTTWLAHASGQYIVDTTTLSMTKQDPQAQGSAITYLRRYGWSAVLGLVTDEDDDDGNAATIVAKVDPNAAKGRAEFQRVVDAAKRAGISKDDAQSHFFKKYGKPLTANVDLIGYLVEYADELTNKAVGLELAAQK